MIKAIANEKVVLEKSMEEVNYDFYNFFREVFEGLQDDLPHVEFSCAKYATVFYAGEIHFVFTGVEHVMFCLARLGIQSEDIFQDENGQQKYIVDFVKELIEEKGWNYRWASPSLIGDKLYINEWKEHVIYTVVA